MGNRRHPMTWLVFLSLMLWTFQVHANKSGVSPNVLILPQGPGSLGGIGENVRTNLNMGLMSYPIAVELPAGRNSFTPSVQISYSSSAGSGVMGIGWGLNVGGSVERLTVRGLPTYTSQDMFFSGNGELVKVPSTPFYRARYEGGFVRYRWHQTDEKDQKGYWTAEYPNGEKAYFGANHKGEADTNSQIYGAKGTFRWELKSRIDRNGNRIEYTYFRSGNQVYLERIDWVFNKAGKSLYKIEFEYETRPDPISDGKPGFDVVTNRRVKVITVFSDGQRIRSYHFGFDSPSGLSRLTSVSRFGIDPKKAHPIRFEMKYSEATFSPSNSRMVKIPTSVSQDFKSNNSDLIDMNGDGLPDVVDTSKEKHRFHMNVVTIKEGMVQNKHDYPTSKIVENPQNVSARLSNSSVQMLDYDGDGYTDLLDAVNKKIYINKGNSRWEDKSQALNSFPAVGTDPNMRFFDYNGDKAVDVISSNGTSTTYWTSDAKGSWKRVDGGEGIGASFSTDKVKLIDMNGDSLTDAVQIFGGKLRYKKYYGYGVWSKWIQVEVPGLEQSKLDPDKAQFADINGDGLADMVAFLGNSIRYFVNRNGIKFSEGKELKSFQGVDLPDSTQNSIRIADMNGNGSRDIVWISSSGQVTYLELFSLRPNLLKEITNGIGMHTEIGYGSSVYHRIRDEALGQPWKNKLPMPFVVVNWIKTWNETDGKTKPVIKTQRIYYHNGYYDGKHRKFRGFRKVETVFEGDNSIAEQKQLMTYNVGDEDSYFHGKLLQRSVTDNKKLTFHNETWEWKDCGTPAGADKGLEPPVRFICMQGYERQTVEGETSKDKWKTTRRETKYDGFGNVVLQSNLGEKSKNGDEKYTRFTYITPGDPKAPESKWFLRLPQKVEICSDLSKPCAEIQYFYDGPEFEGLPAGKFDQGNLVRVAMRKKTGEDDAVVPQRNKYDSYGNVVAKKGPTGLLRTVEWDPDFQRFPISETIHLKTGKLTATTEWNQRFSQVTQSKDFNLHSTFYKYDTFGRLVSISMPGDTAEKPSMVYSYEIKSPISRIITEQRTQQGGELNRKMVHCMDGRGRTLSKSFEIASSKYLVMQHSSYNKMGGRAMLWNAYESDNDCSFEAPTEAKGTSFQYDSLARLVKTTKEDGSVLRTVYKPFLVIEYDEEDNRKESPHYNTPKTTELDGLGRAIKVTELTAPERKIVTQYTYNFVNVLQKDLIASVVFPDGKSKTHEHDLLGRTLVVTDPDRKTMSFTYDDNGNVTKRTDSRGISTVFKYDEIDRLLEKQQEGKDETRITYSYDVVHQDLAEAVNVKTRLARVTYPGGSELFSYDKRGNMTLKRHIYMGVAFDFKREYDNDDRLTAETYPDGRRLTYSWDNLGRATSIPGKIETIQYLPTGMIKHWKAANGVETNYQFDARKRLKSIDVKGGSVLKLDYTLDSSNNILAIAQKHGDASYQNTYTYDALYRLQKAVVADNQEELNYKQDDLYNLTSKLSNMGDKSAAHVGELKYDKQKIHAVTQAGSAKLSYDDAGYLTKRDGWEHRWDYMGRRTETLHNGKVVGRYSYDSGPTRTLKWEQGQHTFYIDTDFEIRNGYGTIYVRLGDNRIAAWKSTKILAKFYDDLAPAEGEGTLKASPDGKITAADAWLYHANRNKQLTIPVRERPQDSDLTDDMLQASLAQMFTSKEQPEPTVYFHNDHLGSTRAVTDEKGQVIGRKHYYPYGQVRKQTGSIYSFGFMGSERDTGSNVNAFRARAMDTHLGKWLSPDPAFHRIQSTNDEWNSYGSVLNNPVRFRDLDGTSSSDVMENAHWAGLGFGVVALTLDLKDTWIARGTKYKKNKKEQKVAQRSKVVAGGIGITLVVAASVFKDMGDGDVSKALMIAALGTGLAGSASSFREIRKKQAFIREKGQKFKAGNSTRWSYRLAAFRVAATAGALVSHILGEGEAAMALAVSGVAAGQLASRVFTNKAFGLAKRGKKGRRKAFKKAKLNAFVRRGGSLSGKVKGPPKGPAPHAEGYRRRSQRGK